MEFIERSNQHQYRCRVRKNGPVYISRGSSLFSLLFIFFPIFSLLVVSDLTEIKLKGSFEYVSLGVSLSKRCVTQSVHLLCMIFKIVH